MTVAGGYAKVTIQEIDLSERVPGFPGVYGGIVVPTKFGPVDVPVLCTSEAHYLKNFTSDERINIGDTLAHFSALAFLQKSNKLWVRRPLANNYAYGGIDVAAVHEVASNAAWAVGEEDPTAHIQSAETLISFYQQNPGQWGNDYCLRLWNKRKREDVLLGEDTISFGPATAASGDIRGVINITAEPGTAGNINVTLVEDPAAEGSAESTTIQAVAAAAGIAGTYFTASTPTTNYYVWFTFDGTGDDPALPAATAVPVALVTGDDAAAVAGKIQAALDAITGFTASVLTDTVTLTNDDNGLVSPCTDGAISPTGYTITQLNQGEDDTISAIFSVDTLTIGLVNGSTTQQEIANAIASDSHIASATATTPSQAWDIGAGVNTVLLAGGTEDPNTIAVSQHWVSGEPIRLIRRTDAAGDALPAGLADHQVYYIHEVSATAIKLCNNATDAFNGENFVDITDTGQGTMQIIPLKEVNEPDAILIEVYRSDNLNFPVEQFVVSLDTSKTNGYGQNMYIEDVLQSSRYIRAMVNPLSSGDPRPIVDPIYFAGGKDGGAITDGDMMLAADAFANKGSYPLTVLMDGGWATPFYGKHIDSIVTNRKDSIAILSTPYDKEASLNYLNDLVDYRRNILNIGSSHAALFSPHLKIYDKYNDRPIFVAPDGYASAAISYSAYNYEMWYPPAGFKRGMVNAVDCRRRFSDGEMDYLYDNDINPVRFFPGKGISIWGQKTLLGRASALDRMNVRLLLIVLEPAIASALENFLFELNDVATRKRVESMINSYMETIKGRGGVYDFMTQCDDDNNTDNDIDNHILNVHVFIKPTIDVEYIPFKMVIMRTGMSFELAQESV